MVKKEKDLLGAHRSLSRSTRWMCFRSHLQPSWRVRPKCGFVIYSGSGRWWHARGEFVPTQTFLSIPAVKLFSLYCHVVLCFFNPPRAVKMQPGSAAVLTVLSVFFGLGCLSAHRSKPDQNDRNAQSGEAGEKKKNQPHIVFILIDDQVSERDAVNLSWSKNFKYMIMFDMKRWFITHCAA